MPYGENRCRIVTATQATIPGAFTKALFYIILRLLVYLFHELRQTAEGSHAAHPAAVFEGR
jgi:hypothetical protein